MQKQYSESNYSDDKYSIYSKSGRKLYRRINNNIRVLNKSKLSNNSNNSIGSVALRRTQLSNDKIYSRQQEMISLNKSQLGISFDTAFNIQSQKKSVPLTPLMSNDNYRQRVRNSPSQRSLRSDSQKSSKFRPNQKKYNKNEIQKLLMLQGDTQFNNPPQKTKQLFDKRQYIQKSKRQKDSINSSRRKQDKIFIQQDSKLGSMRTIKSSSKSNLKLNSSRNLKEQGKYSSQAQQTNKMYQLSQKYKQMISPQPLKYSRNKNDYEISNEQHYERQTRQRKGLEEERQKLRNLQKYQSQKYIPTNQSQIYSRKSGKKRTYVQEPTYIEQSRDDTKKLSQNRDMNYYDGNNHRSRKMNQNSLEKYQVDTWSRNMHRKALPAETNYINQRLYIGQQMTQNQKKKPFPDYKEDPSININYQRQYYKSDEQRGNLKMKSKYSSSQIRNIRIKQENYANLYGSYRAQEENIAYGYSNQKEPRNKNKHQSPQYQSPKQRPKCPPDHEYYHHLNTPKKKNLPHTNSPQTQISQTFDSLILSINSHITSSSIHQTNSIKSIIDKINLHLGTLRIISDYAQEFKKMYEQVDQWEQLIFLSFKKFWVQRVKVLEYLKKFRKVKRHQSQRMPHNGSKKLIDNKLMSNKNICSEIPQLSNNEDPFAQESMIENPFIIPFCKVSEQEVKRVIRTQEGTILLQQIQKQTGKVYQSLQQMYNLIISKSGDRINMLYCDNFSDQIFVMMLEEIEQLIPNLEEFKLFEATKIRLGKIVKSGILILYLNGKVIRNISQIITFDDCEKIGNKKKIKTFTTYDLYYEVLEKIVGE